MTALKAIHVGFRQLGITEDDDKRAIYQQVTGKPRLTLMSSTEQDAVVSELRRRGFKAASKSGRKQLEGRFAKKLQALWIAGWNLGVVSNNSDEAMTAFIQRQTKIDHVRFLRHEDDGTKAIEGLKAWLTREAKVDWTTDNSPPAWVQKPQGKIAIAQWNILGARGLQDERGFVTTVWLLCRPGGLPNLDSLSSDEWKKVMNHLGQLIRKAPK